MQDKQAAKPSADEFKDPLDYDSEIEYGSEASGSGDFDQYKNKKIDFKRDYEPLRIGLKQEHLMIVIEY